MPELAIEPIPVTTIRRRENLAAAGGTTGFTAPGWLNGVLEVAGRGGAIMLENEFLDDYYKNIMLKQRITDLNVQTPGRTLPQPGVLPQSNQQTMTAGLASMPVWLWIAIAVALAVVAFMG